MELMKNRTMKLLLSKLVSMKVSRSTKVSSSIPRSKAMSRTERTFQNLDPKKYVSKIVGSKGNNAKLIRKKSGSTAFLAIIDK